MGGNHLLAVWRDASLSMKTCILLASEFSSPYPSLSGRKRTPYTTALRGLPEKHSLRSGN